VEDDVDVWRYTIVSCMPETMTTHTDTHKHWRPDLTRKDSPLQLPPYGIPSEMWGMVPTPLKVEVFILHITLNYVYVTHCTKPITINNKTTCIVQLITIYSL